MPTLVQSIQEVKNMAKEPPEPQQKPASSESRDFQELQGKGKANKKQFEACRRVLEQNGYAITATYSDL